ncbi:hypothetical protein CALCODRAFT_27905 [Calocera cornea HHB12733]|uniref:Uncharacterized protein n=1 Tax=Calocera cornea HHB12733 TaxID=1353952 RepID=A0A165J4B2_9BASI|nr:hypothetical protein CALCODRAFT_27905 [Calocera cornea HHB12733]
MGGIARLPAPSLIFLHPACLVHIRCVYVQCWTGTGSQATGGRRENLQRCRGRCRPHRTAPFRLSRRKRRIAITALALAPGPSFGSGRITRSASPVVGRDGRLSPPNHPCSATSLHIYYYCPLVPCPLSPAPSTPHAPPPPCGTTPPPHSTSPTSPRAPPRAPPAPSPPQASVPSPPLARWPQGGARRLRSGAQVRVRVRVRVGEAGPEG